MTSDTPLGIVAAERLRRIFGEPDPDDGRIAVVATQDDAERLHRLSTAAHRDFMILVTDNPDQKPAIADGGSLRAMLDRIALNGTRIHDPVTTSPGTGTLRLWSPRTNPTSFSDAQYDRLLNRPLSPGDMNEETLRDA